MAHGTHDLNVEVVVRLRPHVDVIGVERKALACEGSVADLIQDALAQRVRASPALIRSELELPFVWNRYSGHARGHALKELRALLESFRETFDDGLEISDAALEFQRVQLAAGASCHFLSPSDFRVYLIERTHALAARCAIRRADPSRPAWP